MDRRRAPNGIGHLMILGLKAHFIVSPPTIMSSLSEYAFHKTMSS